MQFYKTKLNAMNKTNYYISITFGNCSNKQKILIVCFHKILKCNILNVLFASITMLIK